MKNPELYELEYSKNFETGLVSDKDFYEQTLSHLGVTMSYEDFCVGYNALFLEIPQELRERVEKLSCSYKIYALSNTNIIHANYFMKDPIFKSFDYPFLSHEVGYRKPNLSIYNHLLEKTGHAASDLLFFDDRLDNIEAAKSVAFRTFHVKIYSDFLRELDKLDE